jgi:hypothetical protein
MGFIELIENTDTKRLRIPSRAKILNLLPGGSRVINTI